MLSALIPSAHSYPTVPLVGQPVHQRCVHFGPLVLEVTLLKFPCPQQIETELSHACISIITNGIDYIFTLSCTSTR